MRWARDGFVDHNDIYCDNDNTNSLQISIPKESRGAWCDNETHLILTLPSVRVPSWPITLLKPSPSDCLGVLKINYILAEGAHACRLACTLMQ
jgi:hypothetical protein